MDIDFPELKTCPSCGRQGTLFSTGATIGLDVQTAKRCSCGFEMIILIPNKQFTYFVTREPKSKDK